MKIENIYKYIREHPFKFVIKIIIVILIVQGVIDLLYKIGISAPLIKTNFSANDILSYWGAFIVAAFGSSVTIIGVFITISYYKEQTKELVENGNETTRNMIENSRKDTEETNRKSVLPFIVMNRIITQYKGFFFTIPDEENSKIEKFGFSEKEIGEFYFIIYKEKLTLQIELNEKQELRLNNAYKTTKNEGVILFSQPDYAYFPFKITNVGVGPAINMIISLIKNELVGDLNYHLNTIAFSMKVGQEIKLAFFVDHPENCIGDYKLVISYSDINSKKYQQEHQLVIMDGESTFNLEVNQKLL